jgi:hypothetical protein
VSVSKRVIFNSFNYYLEKPKFQPFFGQFLDTMDISLNILLYQNLESNPMNGYFSSLVVEGLRVAGDVWVMVES